MLNLKVTIDGPPIPLKRARISRHRMYDPQSALKEATLWEVCSQLPTTFNKLHRLPCTIDFKFLFQPPKSLSKKKQSILIDSPHIKKPDIDNLIKFYLDACNSVLYYDDSQVYAITASKMYHSEPKTVLTITVGEPK